MSLTKEERELAADIYDQHHGSSLCPKCREPVAILDSGEPAQLEDPDGWPIGAYALCESCGWSWPAEGP